MPVPLDVCHVAKLSRTVTRPRGGGKTDAMLVIDNSSDHGA
jgi:hypothetical protein